MADLSFTRRGSGEPLLLIHGIGHRWQAWEPVLDRLAAAHDVVALDLPGFGGSPVPAGGMPAGMAGTVARMPELFALLGVDRPHVAGNSLGGAIALELRRGRGFRPVARSARRYEFTGTPAVPVTVAWGTRDRVLPPHQADRARGRLPDARHVLLPGCGHVPMSDDPELVASVILSTTAIAARSR